MCVPLIQLVTISNGRFVVTVAIVVVILMLLLLLFRRRRGPCRASQSCFRIYQLVNKCC